MASTVTKKIEIQKKWIESLQAMYGPDVSISFIVDTLLEAYCELTKDHYITIDKFKKEAVKNADTILRESSEI